MGAIIYIMSYAIGWTYRIVSYASIKSRSDSRGVEGQFWVYLV